MLWPEKIETKDILNSFSFLFAKLMLSVSFSGSSWCMDSWHFLLPSAKLKEPSLSAIPREEKKLLLASKSKARGREGAETSFMKWQLL